MAPQEARNTTLSPIFNLLKIKGEYGAIGGGRLTAERGGNQAAPRPCSRKKRAQFLPARLAVLINKSVNQRILIGGLPWPVGPRYGVEMIRVPVHPSQPAIDLAADFDRSIFTEVRLGCGSICADAFRFVPLVNIICELVKLLLLLPPLPSFMLFLFDPPCNCARHSSCSRSRLAR